MSDSKDFLQGYLAGFHDGSVQYIALLAGILNVHKEYDGGCRKCNESWPCKTYQLTEMVMENE